MFWNIYCKYLAVKRTLQLIKRFETKNNIKVKDTAMSTQLFFVIFDEDSSKTEGSGRCYTVSDFNEDPRGEVENV